MACSSRGPLVDWIGYKRVLFGPPSASGGRLRRGAGIYLGRSGYAAAVAVVRNAA